MKYFIALTLLFFYKTAVTQNEASQWYFGDYAGLDFTISPPAALTNGACASYRGSASISDGLGNLLFYTSGNIVWNKAHTIMANGTGLLGKHNSSQSAIIVKQPGNQNIYFVFTLDEAGGPDGLNYSVIDMSLAAGMGSVTVKNVLIHTPSSEKLCAVKHCNGIDTWVVSHDHQSNNFRANLVTAAGVNTVGITSSAGPTLSGGRTIGAMKISPNGKKLGHVTYLPPAFEVYDFDASTGVVSNSLALPVNFPSASRGYGCEFSPDGSKFYASSTSGTVSLLHQWDLCAGPNTAINASHQTFPASLAGQLQLGPDGEIYMARGRVTLPPPPPAVGGQIIIAGEQMLGVIHNPNANGPLINFVNTGQSAAPRASFYGLPNFVAGFYKTPLGQFSYTVNMALSCGTTSFTAPPLTNNNCSATSYTVNNLMWIFGDPASGANNTSPLNNPVHLYNSPGTYTVKLVLYNQCGGVIDTLKQKAFIGQIPLSTAAPVFSVCAGESLVLSASGSSSYNWSTGATTSSIVVSPTITTTYTVDAIDSQGCPLRSVQTVTVGSRPNITVTGSPILCTGRTATQLAAGAASYTWSNGALNSLLTVSPSVTTAYTVTGTAPGGCTASAVSIITISPLPSVSVSGNTTICGGTAFTLVASGASIYGWSDGSHSATLSLVPHPSLPTHSYFVTGVDPYGCYSRVYVTVNIIPSPTISVSGNTTTCAGAVLTQTASGALTYTWSNGETTNPAGFSTLTSNTVISVTGSSDNGCTAKKTVSVSIKPPPVITAADAQACLGDTFTLTATSPTVQGASYTWFPDFVNGYSVTSVADAAKVYSVVIAVGNCTALATSSLTLLPTASLNISPDVEILFGSSTELQVSGGTTYNWGPADYLGCSTCSVTTAFPETSTQFCVTSPVGSCISKACVNVVISCDNGRDLSLPNAFTPNGDNNNDAFCLQGWKECMVSFKAMIFNRWGEQVYESEDPSFCWDGVYKGQLLNADVYVFVIKAKTFNNEVINRKGNITLIR